MIDSPEIIPEGTAAVGSDVVPHDYAEKKSDREPETPEEAEAKGPDKAWLFWQQQITAALTHEKLFRAEGEASERVYFGPQMTVQTDGDDEKALPRISDKTALIHANVDVLKPMIYSETPQPLVRRRFNGDGKSDFTDLMATEAVQRLANYILDTEDFDTAMEGARDDWLIPGRGGASAVYKAQYEMVEEPVVDPATGQPAVDPVTGAPMTQTVKRKTSERVSPKHREWKRMLFCPGHAWDEMPWVAIEHSMTRGQIEKRFGPEMCQGFAFNRRGLIGNSEAAEDDNKSMASIARITGTDETNATTISPFDTASVMEIWNKEAKTVIWWSSEYTRGVLDTVPDPLDLESFYPMPPPLLATTKGRRMTPRPDIRYYEARAEEVEIASTKMSELLNVIAVAGLIPASQADELKKLFEGKNQLIPVQAWIAMLQKGGITDLVQWLPLAPIVQALQALQLLREQAKTEMFEASGVSDVMRAQGDPNETATAQQLKSKYAGLRMSSRQRRMAIFALDMLRILIDMATGLFDTKFIADICGLDLPLTEAERQAEIARREEEMAKFQSMAMLHQQGVAMAEEMAAAQQAAAAPPPMDPMGMAPPPAPMPPMEAPINPGPPPEPPEYDKPVPETSWELVHDRIRSDLRRKISISIETSSTILADEASDKDARVEFIAAFTQFVTALTPMMASGQMPMNTMKEMLLFGVRGFPKSRTLEALIQQLPDEPPDQGPPPEDPSIIVAKIKAGVDKMLQESEQAHEVRMKGVDLIAKAADIATKDPGPTPDVPVPPEDKSPPAKKAPRK